VIKVTGATVNTKLFIAGIKVFGYQTNVAAATVPRRSIKIQVDSIGDPYVLNDKDEIYKYTTATTTWAKKGDNAKSISIDYNDNLWKIKSDTVWATDSFPYLLDSGSWVKRGDQQSSVISIGPKW
jgi:hypothetical protein